MTDKALVERAATDRAAANRAIAVFIRRVPLGLLGVFDEVKLTRGPVTVRNAVCRNVTVGVAYPGGLTPVPCTVTDSRLPPHFEHFSRRITWSYGTAP